VRRKLKPADDGDRQMVAILTCVLTDGLPRSRRPARKRSPGVSSADVILNILARSAIRRRTRSHPPRRRCKLRHAPIADCARYDSLRRIN
jgi:hypothetical protein